LRYCPFRRMESPAISQRWCSAARAERARDDGPFGGSANSSASIVNPLAHISGRTRRSAAAARACCAIARTLLSDCTGSCQPVSYSPRATVSLVGVEILRFQSRRHGFVESGSIRARATIALKIRETPLCGTQSYEARRIEARTDSRGAVAGRRTDC
jgi:hypothetical protein